METKQLNGYTIEFYSEEEFNPKLNIFNWSGGLTIKEQIKRIAADYVGKVSEISEKIAKNVVETVPVEIAPSPSNDMCGDWDYCYKDYKDISECEWVGWGSDANGFSTAKESFQTLSNLEYCTIIKFDT